MLIISAARTWYYKKVLPLIMIGAMSAGTIVIILSTKQPHGPPLLLAIVPIAMMVFFYVLMKFLIFDLADEVQDYGDYLLVRIRDKEEKVYLSNITNVSYAQLQNPPRVTLSLREPCPLGNQIAFIPLLPFSGFITSLHFKNAVVDDLIKRIDATRRK